MRIFLRQCHHNRLLAVPAGLYSVNNYLKFAMQLYFKPTTAKMLSNLKVSAILLLLSCLSNINSVICFDLGVNIESWSMLKSFIAVDVLRSVYTDDLDQITMLMKVSCSWTGKS